MGVRGHARQRRHHVHLPRWQHDRAHGHRRPAHYEHLLRRRRPPHGVHHLLRLRPFARDGMAAPGTATRLQRVSHLDPALLWPDHESRAVTFENPTGERASGGRAAAGRKGAPNRVLGPGERVVLADLTGPGRVTHLWMTMARLRALADPSPPFLRAQLLEVFYEDLTEPSVSVPALDLFGVVHGVPASYASALTACNDGLGLDARIPLPFRARVRRADGKATYVD